jgi:dipeptidyl aminopeptidase/acylaminoacyl peptidase
VALTTLEITGLDYPTVLWAPVTKPFPASILTFIDEADDGGKLLVTNLSDFMETYDTAKFSFTGYLDRIKAPIEINQGTLDPSVPFWWSDSLVQKLKKLEKDVTYIKYPGANHNMTPSWSKVVSDNLVFYGKQL